MTDEVLKRDQNFVTVLAGVSDDVDKDIIMLRVDPITKRLLISADTTPFYNIFVPYTGANADVNLGVYDLSATTLTATSLTATRIPFVGTGGLLTDTSKLVWDNTNQRLDIILNTGTNPTHLNGTALGIVGADNAMVRIGMSSYGIAGMGAFAQRHARGTLAGGLSAVQDTDTLFSLEGWGYGATGYSASPRVFIRGYAGETWTDSTQASYLSLWTTPTSTIVPVRQWSVLSDGSLVSGLDGTSTKNIITDGTGTFKDLLFIASRDAHISVGNQTSGDTDGKALLLNAGNAFGNATGGPVTLSGGTGLVGGEINFQGGAGTLIGGTVSFRGGMSSGLGPAGDISLVPGANTGGGDSGHFILSNPTTFNQAIFNTDLLSGYRTYSFPDITGTFVITGGELILGYKAVTTAYSVLVTDYTIDCTTNTFTVTLPTAVGHTGQIYNIKNSGTGTITVATTSSQTIDGSLTQTLYQWDNLQIQSTGSQWIGL